MGSSASKFSKIVVGNETHKSARNVLERYAESIKQQAAADAEKCEKSLKGNLKDAKFNHDFFKIKSDMPGNPCYLDFAFHSNTPGNQREYRHPCARSMNKNLFNLEGAVCTNSKIKGNEEKINGAGACAPYRRRHICDLNLEHIDVHNVQNIHDLLGNVLVTAKYEGESIVEKHPNRGSSEVCTALARSFADIGDIIRGKDLYLGHEQGNNKLEARLKTIFQNIKNKNKSPLDKLSLEQVREYWWALNREDVWKALTCFADGSEEYFIQSENNTQLFSNPKCGHEQGNVPTNLDYVPQFLRWFDEWADDFCRIKKIKLENVKKACRDEKKRKYCSLNGYDCTKTIWKKGVLHRSNECTGCLVKCNPYEIWLENQRKEFEKQTKKYENEIKTYVHDTGISNSNINNEYYKEFYKKLKDNNYETANEFINLLNEGRYCNKKEKIEEENIDFTKSGDEKGTFYRSDYCQVCPDCGVICEKGSCRNKPNDNECRNKENYNPPKGVNPTEINVINSGDEPGNITQKLKDFCEYKNKENGKNYEQWKCYYVDSIDNKCKVETKSGNSTYKDKIISFDEFFDFWVRKLLIDTIKWETELTYCINNTDVTDCNKCNKNCVCFDKWVKQKEKEWDSIKKLLKKKKNVSKKYYLNINDLFDSFFFQVIYKFNEGEAKWKELKQKLEEKIKSSKQNRGTEDSEAAIKVLLDHLKENATICKDNNTNEACPSTVDTTQNPCGKNSNARNVVRVKQIAQYLKRKAYYEANKRSDGLHKLKGKAHEGIYKRGAKKNDFKDNLCRIMIKHSNRNPGQSQGPCYGKGTGLGIHTRFVVGTVWEKDKTNMREGHGDVIMPPRRQHFCTSNLEYLINGVHQKILKIQKGKINHSFLVHVLLAAKMDAQKINDLYKSQNGKTRLTEENDKATVCRAIRYSFADLGDIIRGNDLWDHNDQKTKLQVHLKNVFAKIKDHSVIKGKYTKCNSPYLELRSDWWEANRHQVWQAMKCHIKDLKDLSIDTSKGHCGYSDHTPLDDYIPQRLRWMTEWAEWFCKYQSQEYEKLKRGCEKCNVADGKCENGNGECDKCKAACEEYKKKIKSWEEQWGRISNYYKLLYAKARITAINGGPDYYNDDVDEEDKPVYDFLYELHLQNGGILGPPPATHPSKSVNTRDKRDATVDTTPTVDTTLTDDKTSTDETIPTVYSTAAGYVHQEMPIVGCMKQEVFCDNNGNKDKYVFREKPKDHDEACGCNERNPKPQPAPKEEVDACKIVKELLKDKKATDDIEKCKGKYKDGYHTYPSWKCDTSKIKSEHSGACMPPRRQKLCVINLKFLNEKISPEDLRKAFIQCAAVETFFLWHKYKTDNNGGADLQIKLEGGEIPEDFKRQMFYTFGDYRDLCLDKDIGNDVSEVEESIKRVFSSNGDKTPNGQSRLDWWGKNCQDIWQGMLCALSYNTNEKQFKDEVREKLMNPQNSNTYKTVKFSGGNSPTLEKFAQTPQFLRWMTEWSDEFCREQKKKYNELVQTCKTCGSNGSVSTEECNNNCDE
ncbi:hypothetical protein PFTANZ_05822, partial [Plasmodium falciparum Tanzania (2000708)]